jgi:hypothetical protein
MYTIHIKSVDNKIKAIAGTQLMYQGLCGLFLDVESIPTSLCNNVADEAIRIESEGHSFDTLAPILEQLLYTNTTFQELSNN